MSDEGLRIILQQSRRLHVLVARNCAMITGELFTSDDGDDGMWSELIFLDLFKCSLHDEGVVSIARRCPGLKSIDVSWNQRVSEGAWLQFSAVIAAATIVADGTTITDVAYNQLVANPSVRMVHSKSCRGLSRSLRGSKDVS